MAKNKNRGPAPSHKTVSILIARAGGRCQFENCNKNVFLDLMDGAFGVKTGFTNNAGYCFVGAFGGFLAFDRYLLKTVLYSLNNHILLFPCHFIITWQT